MLRVCLSHQHASSVYHINTKLDALCNVKSDWATATGRLLGPDYEREQKNNCWRVRDLRRKMKCYLQTSPTKIYCDIKTSSLAK